MHDYSTAKDGWSVYASALARDGKDVDRRIEKAFWSGVLVAVIAQRNGAMLDNLQQETVDWLKKPRSVVREDRL